MSYLNRQIKNSITFQDVEDTSFFDNNIWTSETIYINLLGSIIIKVLGVKHKLLNNKQYEQSIHCKNNYNK